jgi:hypothetical protein
MISKERKKSLGLAIFNAGVIRTEVQIKAVREMFWVKEVFTTRPHGRFGRHSNYTSANCTTLYLSQVPAGHLTPSQLYFKTSWLK